MYGIKLNGRALLAAVLLAAAAALAVPALIPAPHGGTQAHAADSGNGLAPSAQHSETAQVVAKLLSYQHFRRHPIDNELSANVFDAYLNAVDPERYYLLRSDVEEFERYRHRLDDMLTAGDLSVAFRIFNRVQERTRERSEYALQVLADGVDLNTDQTLNLDRRKAEWAESREALDRLWRQRVKHDMLTLLLAGESEDQTEALLRSRYEGMAETIERSSSEDVFETYMSAWGRAFDPHTNYMSPRNSREFDIQMKLSLEGIGAVLRTQRDFTEVVELIPGGPASKSGELQPGDRIIGVAQDDEDMVDVVGWRLRDVVDLIRGPKESTVRLRVLPAAGGSDAPPRTISLVRNEVKLEEQAAQKEILELDRDGHQYRVGVIRIPTFYSDFAAAEAGDRDYRSTTRDVRRLLAELESEAVDALVVDLRGNAGGSLREAADLTGLFISQGPIVQIVRSDGNTEVLRDRDGDMAYDGPLAVMVDRHSASASEIFAGAIQDYGRGLVVGEQTFGKGTVQSLVDLNRFSADPRRDSGRLKLTIAKFYRVTGSSTQQRGVIPDIALPSPVRSDEVGESAVDNALPWDSIRPTSFSQHGDLNRLLPILKQRHEERAATDKAFQALVDEVEKITAIADRTVVSLNRDQRRTEREASNDARLEKANRRRTLYGLEPLESLDELSRAQDEPDTLLHTTAEIVLDLHTLLHRPAVAKAWGAELAGER
ncbi:MAG: carboxy terminal-processing peptidase [Ectothiorhodospiraceae bacterium]|nr:carboxy terminal-processing peptidase [Ectothiorhodospiraceae bacterium]